MSIQRNRRGDEEREGGSKAFPLNPMDQKRVVVKLGSVYAGVDDVLALPVDEPDYFKMATEHGMKCGAFVATLKGIDSSKARNAMTIQRAAVAFVRHLPLNDIPLERKIQAQFELAATMVLNEPAVSLPNPMQVAESAVVLEVK